MASARPEPVSGPLTETLIAYFGYGSLVNRNTLAPGYVAAYPARLRGWCRHWQSRGQSRGQSWRQSQNRSGKAAGEEKDPGKYPRNSAEQAAWLEAIRKAGYNGSVTPQDLALLSVHRDQQSSISGLLVIDRLENLAALDERERLYERVVVPADDLELQDRDALISDVPTSNLFLYVGEPSPPGLPPLLQSYLDTVLLGFLEVHGEDGIEDFLTSTVGFAREIIRDRNAPIYPRAVRPDNGLAARFDALLAQAGVQ